VLPNEVVLGSVVVRDGAVAEIQPGAGGVQGLDLEGDLLLPGLVELHTDNLEHHAMPRPRVSFPMLSAMQAHDAELAAAGITTVLDAIGIGDPYGEGFRAGDQSAMLAVLDKLEAADVLRVDHLLHLRCELPDPNARALFEPFSGHRRLRLLSLMDHTPGQRQWVDLHHARTHFTGKKGWSDAQFDEQLSLAPERQALHAEPNRHWFAHQARQHGVALATHDDATAAHVAQAHALGALICEFPTTLGAARHARALGLMTVAGAPNLLRGGSHAGNVAALTLAQEGVLDVLSSDYVPCSLLQSAWLLVQQAGWSLSAAVAAISRKPALACGLDDRGAIEVGLRADLLRVRELEGTPLVREAYVKGRRVI